MLKLCLKEWKPMAEQKQTQMRLPPLTGWWLRWGRRSVKWHCINHTRAFSQWVSSCLKFSTVKWWRRDSNAKWRTLRRMETFCSSVQLAFMTLANTQDSDVSPLRTFLFFLQHKLLNDVVFEIRSEVCDSCFSRFTETPALLGWLYRTTPWLCRKA